MVYTLLPNTVKARATFNCAPRHFSVGCLKNGGIHSEQPFAIETLALIGWNSYENGSLHDMQPFAIQRTALIGWNLQRYNELFLLPNPNVWCLWGTPWTQTGKGKKSWLRVVSEVYPEHSPAVVLPDMSVALLVLVTLIKITFTTWTHRLCNHRYTGNHWQVLHPPVLPYWLTLRALTCMDSNIMGVGGALYVVKLTLSAHM